MSEPLLAPRGGTQASRRIGRRGLRWDAKQVILALVTAFLVYQVIVPLFFLIWGSLKTVGPTDRRYFSPDLSLANYVSAVESNTFWVATWNTLVYALGSTLLAAFLGVSLALIAVRTDAPLKSLISLLAYARIIIPGLLTSISWVFLGSPEIGILNRLYQNLFGASGPLFDIYSLGGMIWVQALDVFPLVYLTVGAALRSMDPSLEEAAFMAGKPVLYTLARVTFPLMRPALLASSILVFIHSLESFEVPLIIGLPEKIYVLSTQIFFKTAYTPVDYGVSGAFGVMLLVIALGCVYLYQRVTRRSDAYMTVTGKAFRPRVIPLGRWRWAAAAGAMAVMFCSVILPSLVLLWASFQRFFQPPSLRALESASLRNYVDVVTRDAVFDGIRNSLILSMGAATFVVATVSIIAWMVYRTRLRGRQALDALAFAPQAIPPLLFAVSMLWLYLVLPVPVYGTLWIILLAYVTRYLPVAMRIVSSGMVQVHRELEEAAYVCGASWGRSFRRILTPLLRPVLVTGWIWVVIHAFRELSVSAVLSGPDTRTVGVTIYSFWTEGSFGLISAFSVVVMVLLIAIASLAERIGRRFGVNGLE